MDFSRITDRVLTGGGITSPEDAQELAQQGVTAVVDCRAETDDAPFFAGMSLSYLWNPAQDDGLPKPADWFDRTLTFVLPLLARPHEQIYLHCAAGVNRGPSHAYVVLRACGWDAASAETLMRAKRPQVGLAYKADADRAVVSLGYALS